MRRLTGDRSVVQLHFPQSTPINAVQKSTLGYFKSRNQKNNKIIKKKLSVATTFMFWSDDDSPLGTPGSGRDSPLAPSLPSSPRWALGSPHSPGSLGTSQQPRDLPRIPQLVQNIRTQDHVRSPATCSPARHSRPLPLPPLHSLPTAR